MCFFEIVFENLINLLASCCSNTSSHYDARDEDQTIRASSSSTPLRQNYDVFLSFRGKDTRHDFTDHLYYGLQNRGIEVFRDNEELHVGEKIHQLFDAIKASKISIPIISPDYASSIWCLKELLQILECKKMSGQLVLPIFYHVKPSDVREQKGNFGKKFCLCKWKHNLGGKFIQELKDAFEEVAIIKVWEVNETMNRYEGKLVEEVVTRIFNELRKSILVVPDFLVGVEDHVKEIRKMIDAKPPSDAKIIGIHGMGGIGKTTLAKALYNALCNDFECCSFVPNIREASQVNKGMETLQKQIISDILVYKSPEEISHVDEGINIIERRFKGKKLLLLLDDVENEDQLNKLVAKNSWFGSESIVIITTRNIDVTVKSMVNLSYPLNELNDDQSYELFCKHAFGSGASCPRDLETLATEITSTTGGLPLAIEVIGSMLHQKDKDFWKEALEKLRKVPNKKVQDILRISYDYLEYGQQQIFLDIACLSILRESEFEDACYMWKSCDFYPKEGIEKLISLSLIKRRDSYYAITIHDQLRDLGKEIVRKEGRDNISRIWSQKEAKEVMERKQGTHNLQALFLPISTEYDEPELHYRSEDFEGMPNLRFLRMGNVHLSGDFENRFPKLRWLCWGDDRTDSVKDFMGINFNPKELVVLGLYNCNITEHWKGWNHKDLKVIKLYECMNITTTPDFSVMEELEVLILNYCRKLKKIHPSIGKFKKTLKVFEVISCHEDLEELPTELWKMEELRELDISYPKIPISEGCMTMPPTLGAYLCKSLPIPDSLNSLVKLQHFTLSATGVKELPDSIGQLCNLESLSISTAPIECLPTSIEMLSKLIALGLWECTELKALPKLPSSLTHLHFHGDSMETFPDLSNLTNLKFLKYKDVFQRRNKALNLGDLSQLETLVIGYKFKFLDRAKELDMAPENFSLQLKLPISLRYLEIYNCQTLRTLPYFSNFKNLYCLDLKNCSELMEINGLEGAESLTDLRIHTCRKLSRLGDLSHLKRLRNVSLSLCDKLSDVQGVEKCTSLIVLEFHLCHPKIKFPDLSMLKNLKHLRIVGVEELMEISWLQELQSLEFLQIHRCMSLQCLPDLSQCTNLRELVVEDCEKLTKIQGLENLPLLKELRIYRCPTLSNLPNLPNVSIKSDALSKEEGDASDALSEEEGDSDPNPLENKGATESDSNSVD